MPVPPFPFFRRSPGGGHFFQSTLLARKKQPSPKSSPWRLFLASAFFQRRFDFVRAYSARPTFFALDRQDRLGFFLPLAASFGNAQRLLHSFFFEVGQFSREPASLAQLETIPSFAPPFLARVHVFSPPILFFLSPELPIETVIWLAAWLFFSRSVVVGAFHERKRLLRFDGVAPCVIFLLSSPKSSPVLFALSRRLFAIPIFPRG